MQMSATVFLWLSLGCKLRTRFVNMTSGVVRSAIWVEPEANDMN